MTVESAEAPARSEGSTPRWRRPFQGWMDGVEAGWAIPVLLICFFAVWLAFAAIAFCTVDLHPDALDTWSSGRSLAWGYERHAPLAAWLTHGWASLFPLTNWSFQLLALTDAVLALWAIDLIAGRLGGGDKRAVVLLLLMLLPIYQFQVERFDADAVLLAAWPLATYCFLRSFETRQLGWAIAAGLTAALAMLGKYQSVFLIASFMVAAILHPQRRAYLASPAPWVSSFVGLAALGPHLFWLRTIGAKPFAAALARLTAHTSAAWLIEMSVVLLILALALLIPLLIWSLVGASQFRKFYGYIAAIKPSLLLVLLVAIGTNAFPVITAIGLKIDMTPVWQYQGLFLLAIVIVCATNVPIARERCVDLAALAAAAAVAAVVLVAPLHAFYRNYVPLPEGRNYFRLSAAELTRQWHARSDQPLAVVGGDRVLALAMAFYSPDHPVVEARLVRPNAENLPPETKFERGWASLCFDGDAGCSAAMEKVAAVGSPFVRSEFAVESHLLGLRGDQQRFQAILVSPATAPPAVDLPAPGPLATPAPVAASAPVTAPPEPGLAPSPVTGSSPLAAAPSVPVPAPAVPSSSVAALARADVASSPGEPTPPAAPAPAITAPPSAADQPNPPEATGRLQEQAEGAASEPREAVSSPGTGRRPVMARRSSGAVFPAVAASLPGDNKLARRADAPVYYKAAVRGSVARAVAEYKLNWARWAAAQRATGGCPAGPTLQGWTNPCCASCWSAVRTMAAASQPISSSGCASRAASVRCGPRLASVGADRNSAGVASSVCGSAESPHPSLAHLARPLCALLAFLDSRRKGSQRAASPPGPAAKRLIAAQLPRPISEPAGLATADSSAPTVMANGVSATKVRELPSSLPPDSADRAGLSDDADRGRSH